MLSTERRNSVLALIFIVFCLLMPADAIAETVSIVTHGETTEHNLVEAGLKRHLRAEGFTVKGGTREGYLLLVTVIPNITRAGYKSGVTGHLTVSSLSWQDLGDTLVSEKCKEDYVLAQSFKEIIGVRIIYIDSYMATASDEEQLAELMSTYANRQIRTASNKVTNFFEEFRKRSGHEVSSPPSIELMR